MKTASKVFIIIAMCRAPLLILLSLVNLATFEAMFASRNPGFAFDFVAFSSLVIVFSFISLAVVETIGGLALHKLSVATSKDQLLVMGIITLIFCSLLGGIFMLCISDNDLKTS